MDLSNHVLIPSEDFFELQASASEQPTTHDRIASTLQTTAVFGAIAGAITLGGLGWAKVQDWREERAFQRKIALIQQNLDASAPK